MERFAIEGVVATSDGAPIARAHVVVEGWIGSRRHGETETDEAGRFRVDAPRGVRLLVTAQARGFVPKIEVVERALSDPAASTSLRFRLVAGGRVVGIVRHADGSPAAGATVHLAPQQGTPIEGPEFFLQGTSLHVSSGQVRAERPRTATSDREGRFEVDGVPFGQHHRAAAAASGFGTGPAVSDIRTTPDAPEADVEIVLPEPSTVSVQVVDEAGAPVEGANLFLGQSDHGLEERTDREGRATFHGVEMQPWSDVFVEAVGFVRTMWVLRGRRHGTIPLPRPVRVTGTVRDERGEPVLNAHVSASPSFESDRDVVYSVDARASSRRDGSLALEGLPPGPIVVQAVAPGHAEIERIETVAGASPLEIVLPREVRVRGRLVLAEGERPPNGFRIVLPAVRDRNRKEHHPTRPTWERPFWRSETHSWEGGRVEVSGLPAAPVAIWLQPDGSPAVLRTVAGRPGEVVDIGDVAAGAVVLEGRVLSPDGRALPGAHVAGLSAPEATPFEDALRARARPTPTAETDADGVFRLDGFPRAGGPVRVGAEGYAPALHVVSGSPTIVLERGAAVSVRMRPGSQPIHRRVHFHPVLDGVVLPEPIAVASRDRADRFVARLAPGRYWATLELGPFGRGVRFEVGDGDIELDIDAP